MDEVVGIDPAKRGRWRWPQCAHAPLRLPGAGHRGHSLLLWPRRLGCRLLPGLKTIEDATEIRRRVLLAFELAERQMARARLAPAAQLSSSSAPAPRASSWPGPSPTLLKLYMRHDFRHIDPSKARVLSAGWLGPRILAAYPPKTSPQRPKPRWAGSASRSIRLTHVTGIGPGWVEAGGKRIEAVVTLWAAGVEASPLGRLLGTPLDQARLRSWWMSASIPPGLPDVFVLGDLAHRRAG
jgi:NADH dehydrogenase